MARNSLRDELFSAVKSLDAQGVEEVNSDQMPQEDLWRDLLPALEQAERLFQKALDNPSFLWISEGEKMALRCQIGAHRKRWEAYDGMACAAA